MRHSQLRLSCWLLLLTALQAAQAANVVEQVPHDALGFIVVSNLSQADAKTAHLLNNVGVEVPAPLTMIQSITGVGLGLDRKRDLLIALLPPESRASPRSGGRRAFHLAVWLPVSDYDALVRSLEGDPERRLAAVTIAGEDLLVVRHGDWAVVMDPDQRARLEQLRDAPPSQPRQAAQWRPWVEKNDAALVVLPAGMRTAWQWMTLRIEDSRLLASGADVPSQDLFGRQAENSSADGAWSSVLASLRSLLDEAPEFGRWLAEAEGAACGLRLDRDGNLAVSVRLALSSSTMQPANADQADAQPESIPRLYDSGLFVIAGEGSSSARWAVPAVAPYVRQMVSDLAKNYGSTLDEADVTAFRRAMEEGVADVNAFSVLTRPGEGEDGVFTNNILAVRVADADAFVKHVTEAMRRWNAMLDKSQGGIRMLFESTPVTIDQFQGTEYSLDVAEAVGAPAMGVQAMPEFRRSMERLFGPGGKFRLQSVKVDDHTVLLAAATQEQAAQVIRLIRETSLNASDQPNMNMGDARRLLTDRADWRIYFSLSGYNRWLERQMDAIVGQVIGGPIVRQFADAPPIALAGGVDGAIVWAELAAPAETLRAVGQYVRP